ncbi:xanthine dehydrogenase small subunit [Elongatibacter sediminis]|uniref:Xanthine dehydrogenase small subunit n=1 Tax=Elongatibacter sediminis TaxID=3119006 RepID=A0AAW9R9H6_9GAMM
MPTAVPIRFLLGDELCEPGGFDPHTTVLEWLRGRADRRGTKEGCAEGDCGACTVAVGERRGETVRYRAFNACILPLAALDGKQLLTVEDLAEAPRPGAALHPVQQAMVDTHGAQCGFCTPGFVMSLFTLHHRHRNEPDRPVNRSVIDRVLAGNLCRCTGYAPIVRAARRSVDAAGPDRFEQQAGRTAQRLAALERGDDARFTHDGVTWAAPRSLAALLEWLRECPDARMVAGATDVGLWVTKQLQRFETLLYVGEVEELRRVELTAPDGPLEIGAAVRYSDALDLLSAHYPGMREMLLRLGAEQVRNAGTIGGNIANGSPIGDMPPALIALGARLVLARAGAEGGIETREIDLEDFFIEYGRQDLRPGECVARVRLPLPRPDQYYSVYKISKRFVQDISALCGAFHVRLDGERVADARIAYGGMAGVPRRARAAEQALLGQVWSEDAIEHAREAMADDFEPLSDWRASSSYRMLAARNLLRRFWLESASGAPQRLVVGA